MRVRGAGYGIRDTGCGMRDAGCGIVKSILLAPERLYRVGLIWVNKQRTPSVKLRALRLESALTIGFSNTKPASYRLTND